MITTIMCHQSKRNEPPIADDEVNESCPQTVITGNSDTVSRLSNYGIVPAESSIMTYDIYSRLCSFIHCTAVASVSYNTNMT